MFLSPFPLKRFFKRKISSTSCKICSRFTRWLAVECCWWVVIPQPEQLQANEGSVFCCFLRLVIYSNDYWPPVLSLLEQTECFCGRWTCVSFFRSYASSKVTVTMSSISWSACFGTILQVSCTFCVGDFEKARRGMKFALWTTLQSERRALPRWF